MAALFDLGAVVATPGALEVLEASETSPVELLARHVAGDWGELGAEDRVLNDQAVQQGLRIFSAYDLAGGRVYLITEHDRSATTILLPEEY